MTKQSRAKRIADLNDEISQVPGIDRQADTYMTAGVSEKARNAFPKDVSASPYHLNAVQRSNHHPCGSRRTTARSFMPPKE